MLRCARRAQGSSTLFEPCQTAAAHPAHHHAHNMRSIPGDMCVDASLPTSEAARPASSCCPCARRGASPLSAAHNSTGPYAPLLRIQCPVLPWQIFKLNMDLGRRGFSRRRVAPARSPLRSGHAHACGRPAQFLRCTLRGSLISRKGTSNARCRTPSPLDSNGGQVFYLTTTRPFGGTTASQVPA